MWQNRLKKINNRRKGLPLSETGLHNFVDVKSPKQDYILISIGNQHSSAAFCVKFSCRWRHKITVKVDIDAFIWKDFNANSEPNSADWTAIGTGTWARVQPRSIWNVPKLVAVALAMWSKQIERQKQLLFKFFLSDWKLKPSLSATWNYFLQEITQFPHQLTCFTAWPCHLVMQIIRSVLDRYFFLTLHWGQEIARRLHSYCLLRTHVIWSVCRTETLGIRHFATSFPGPINFYPLIE